MSDKTKYSYTIRRRSDPLPTTPNWENNGWAQAEMIEVASFRPESSKHRPQTLARLLYDEKGIHGQFHVHDRYVYCVRTNYMDDVWKDSCVEFFIQPKAEKGYFNFEFNCGGAFLLCYITDPTRVPDGFKRFVRVPEAIAKITMVTSSLPRIVKPEIKEPVDWTLQFFIPFRVLENYVGALGNVRGQVWRGNFFKCAEENSRPHWASWSPVDELNFHLPRCFGEIRFG